MECGGKRSATPLLLDKDAACRKDPLNLEIQSGVALRLPPHSIKLAVVQRVISYGLLCGQIHANDLLIIPGVHVAVCEGGMRPEHITSGRGIGGLEQMRAADLLVTFGAEPGDD